MAASSPASLWPQILDGELSFNLFHHDDSTVLQQRSALGAPQGFAPCGVEVMATSPRRRRVGESPLRPRDSNAPLIDVESTETPDRATSKLLAPRTPSGYARSLLDKTPGVWKAQLGTPLIPLGTPVTHRKKIERRTPAPASDAKENATPGGSVRRSARLAGASPCPVPVAASPTPAATPSSPAVVSSPRTPQQTVTTENEQAGDKPETALDPQITEQEATEAGDDAQADPSPICTPEKARMSGLGSRLVPRSPFQPFSPATPAPQLFASARSSEDSDSEADSSILEVSSPAAVDPRQAAVVEAFQRLAFRDTPVKTAAPSSSSETALVEDSIVLTATEVESSEDEFDDELEDSVELEAICEENDGEGERSTDPSSASETEAEQVRVEPATEIDEDVDPSAEFLEDSFAEQEGPILSTDIDIGADDTTPADDSVDATLECSVSGILDETHDALTPSAVFEPALLPPADLSGTSTADDSKGIVEHESAADEVLDTPAGQQVDHDQSIAPPRDLDGLSPLPSPTASAADSATLALPDDEEQKEEDPAAAVVEKSVDAVVAEEEIATHTAEPDMEESYVAVPISPERLAREQSIYPGTVSVPESAAGTPVRALQTASFESTTPATTPPARLSTPSAIGTGQTLVNAAPTARRQLSKLTSVASQRSGVPVKSSLTALNTPATSGSLRGLPVPSRLAAPKRADGLSSSRSDITGPTFATAVRQRAPAAQSRPGLSSTAANPLRSSVLSASTSSTSSSEQSRAVRGVVRPAPRAATALNSKSADIPSESLARAGRPAITSRARLGPTVPIGSTAMVNPRSAITTGPRPATAEVARSGARPRTVTTARTLASLTGPAHTLAKTGSLTTVAPLSTAANGRTPRAAVSMRQTTSAPSLSASTAVISPRKLEAKSRNEDRPTKAGETCEPSSSTASPDGTPTNDTDTPDPIAEQGRAGSLGSQLSGAKAEVPVRLRSPTRATIFASPARLTAQPPRSSPLRSPRRVIVSQTSQRPQPVATKPATSLLAPAPTLSSAAPAVFGGAARPVQPRMTRMTRRTAAASTVPTAPAALPAPAPLSRPVRAAAASARVATSSSSAPGPPPGGRMARKLTRRPHTPAQDEAEAAEAESTTVEENEAATPADSSERAAVAVRPQPSFRPAPALTQDELNRLTQRNTKKNQQTFNQLKVETVFLDYDRPPSPTSKIRKSSALANAASKEGREARAAKRRNALRASVDGSELETLSQELSVEAVETPPKEHYRAPGDEEPYITPARTALVLKSGSSGKAASKKKRTSTEAELDAMPEKPVRRVRWDRALVYEGRREGYAKPSQEGIIVIKTADIDPWGNPTAPATNLGKAVPVTIQMRVFKNDDK